LFTLTTLGKLKSFEPVLPAVPIGKSLHFEGNALRFASISLSPDGLKLAYRNVIRALGFD
jgi:hypothetical protein